MSRIISNQCESITNDTSNIYNIKWKSWCRLCAKADEHCVNAISGTHSQPFNENSFSYDINLAYLIAKYFQVEIQEDEKLSQVICLECYKYITALNKFGDRVNNVQQMYDELYKCKDKTRLNMGLLLEKYGIINDESILAHNENELPVEEIFVAGLAITTETESPIVDIKNEVVTVLEQVDKTSQADKEEDEEFHDPIGDEMLHSGKESCTTANCEGSSSGESNYSEDDVDPSTHNNIRLKKCIGNGEEQTCSICSQSFQRRSNYSIHMKKKHGVIVCTQFDEPTSSIHAKKRLKNTIENAEKIICSICAQTFQRRSNFLIHMKKKHGVIVCPQCPSSFENITSLKQHMVEHRKFFNCTQCEQKFDRKGLFGKHMRNKHESGGIFLCETCGDAMTTKKQLTLHMLTHSDYTPYKCKDCGRCFKVKYHLKRHSEIHGDKVICPVCGKQLSCRATFNKHMLIHSDNTWLLSRQLPLQQQHHQQQQRASGTMPIQKMYQTWSHCEPCK